MIELIQFIFATARDQHFYANREGVVRELTVDCQFNPEEVSRMLEWFEPIIHNRYNLHLERNSLRQLTAWEERAIPREIVEQIYAGVDDNSISIDEREILLDRLTELALSYPVDASDLEPIFEGLLFHLQNYYCDSRGLNIPESAFYVPVNNTTVH